MIHLPELDGIEYAQLSMTPLTVTAHLRPGGRVAAFEPPVYLDGLLARCVVDRATCGVGVPDAPYDGYWIPLPLRLTWQSPDGFPLWDCSVFMPVGPTTDDVFYQHKRMNPGIVADTRRVRTVVGRWMERRMPLPVRVCDTWTARCVGHAETIRDLLADIEFIGKRRAIGFGEVERWEVAPAEFDAATVIDGRLAHAIPQGAASLEELPVRVGWTPPYWKAALWLLGWTVGTAA